MVYTGKNFNADINWGFVSIIVIALAAAGYALYQYRIRVLPDRFTLSKLSLRPFAIAYMYVDLSYWNWFIIGLINKTAY